MEEEDCLIILLGKNESEKVNKDVMIQTNVFGLSN